MKLTPIADILRRANQHRKLADCANYIAWHIASEKGDNVRRTSVRIRELQEALHDIQMRRLRREKAA